MDELFKAEVLLCENDRRGRGLCTVRFAYDGIFLRLKIRKAKELYVLFL